MAKRSAYSKGYRKNVKKDKPFLTKKELIALIVIVVVIALAVVLFNILYKPFKEGEIGVYTRASGTRKLGSINQIEGHTMTSTLDQNDVYGYSFTPDTQPEGCTETATVKGRFASSTMLYSTVCAAQSEAAYEVSLYGEDAGLTVLNYSDFGPYYYSITSDSYVAPEGETAEAAEGEAEAEEKPSNTFKQTINCFAHVDSNYYVRLSVERVGADDSFYIAGDDKEALEALLTPYLKAITIEIDKKNYGVDKDAYTVEEWAQQYAELYQAAVEKANADAVSAAEAVSETAETVEETAEAAEETVEAAAETAEETVEAAAEAAEETVEAAAETADKAA